jgi:hypothetical protein
MDLKGLTKMLPIKTVAEIVEGSRYIITYDGCLDQKTVARIQREFAEQGIKGVLCEAGFTFYQITPKTDVTVEDRSGDPVALYVNKAAESLATHVNQYATMPRTLARVADARAYQIKDWPGTAQVDAGGRSTEEWIVLLQAYQSKLVQVYAESNGSTKEGLERLAKYAAIQANLALWLLQAAQGAADNFADLTKMTPEAQEAYLLNQFGLKKPAVAPGETDGCKYHTAPEPEDCPECGSLTKVITLTPRNKNAGLCGNTWHGKDAAPLSDQ